MRSDGTVTSFDHHEGLGWIEGDDGNRYLFHCAELLDGSRDVAIGTRVIFERAIRFGHQEASQIEKSA
jgi:cold shock CspA family protein